MATYTPLDPLIKNFFDDNGNFLSGGTLEAFISGTSTPTAMFANAAGTSAGSTITLNARGEPETSGNAHAVWIDTAIKYDFVLKDSDGVTINTPQAIRSTVLDSIASTATIASAKALAVIENGQAINVQGYTIAGDGGGGEFIYNSSSTETVDSGSIFSLDTLSGRLVRVVKSRLTPKHFGGVGDYTANDTTAIAAWLNYFTSSGKALAIDSGVYRVTNAITLPEGVIINGVGSAKIATFPQLSKNKDLLRPGNDGNGVPYKSTISGSVIIFDGTGTTNTYTMSNRSDKFASFSPMVSYPYAAPFEINGLSIIQDMNVLDASGALTTRSTDGRATAYNAGFVYESTQSTMTDFNVFGYFTVQGVISANPDTAANEDYNTAIDSLWNSGFAILSDDAGDGSGFTGTRTIAGGIYGADHHTRADGWYNGAEEINVVYIDGRISATNSIRGHTFVGTQLRGYVNNSVKLDHADDITFDSCVYEFSTIAGVAGADTNGIFVGTANTGDVRITNPASTNEMGLSAFMAAVGGSVILIGGPNDEDITVSDGGKVVRVKGDSSTGDSLIQLTADPSSITSDWVIRRDDSDSDKLRFMYDNAAMLELGSDGLLNIPSGTWDTQHIQLGTLHLFKNGNDLRLSIGAPSSSTDGVLVATAT